MALEDMVAALHRDQVVVVPTDTVYGLAVRMTTAAVERLFALKGRGADKAFAVLVGSAAQASTLAATDPVAEALMQRFWPGPLTIVTTRGGGAEVDLGGDPETIGLRQPDSEWIRALTECVGPLVTTSANRSGEPPLGSPAEIADFFGDSVAAALDVGLLDGEPSTVVSSCSGSLVILREGPIDAARLRAAVAGLA